MTAVPVFDSPFVKEFAMEILLFFGVLWIFGALFGKKEEAAPTQAVAAPQGPSLLGRAACKVIAVGIAQALGARYHHHD